MSPSFKRLCDDGMPWTISWLIDVQTEPGYPRYPLNAGRAPCSAVKDSAKSSRSLVETPAFTIARIFSSALHTIKPARCIFSSSAGDLQMTISSLGAIDDLRERARNLFHGPGAIHDFQNALRAVILRKGPGLKLVSPQALLDHFRIIIRPLDQLAAVDIANVRHFRRRVVDVVNFPAHAARPAARHAA